MLTNSRCGAILIITMEKQLDNTPSPEELLGAEIDGYRLEALLGNGSYGVVYRARHLMMDRLFAFKILLAEFSEDPESINEFFRESKTAAKLEHPNVVQAYQAGKTAEGLCYFVMEYVDGTSVEDIRTDAPEMLSLEFLLELSIQLAGALEYAWESRKIIHRDIKPENLLIRRSDGKLKLADLGLAGVGGGASSGQIVATPLYMAPEVAAGHRSTEPASDIYSFGVMFYELATGIPPFSGSVEYLQIAHQEKKAPPLLTKNPDFDPELALYIDSMLAKLPGERPRSWSEVRERLSAIKNRLYPAAAPVSVVKNPLPAGMEKQNLERPFSEGRTPFIFILFTVLLLIALVLGIIAFL